MARHRELCPACGSLIDIHVVPHLGGSSEEVVSLSIVTEGAAVASVLASAQAAVERAQADAVAAAKAVLASAKNKKAVAAEEKADA